MEYPFISIGVLIFLALWISTLNMKVTNLQDRLKTMRYTLNQIADQVGVPEHPVNEQIRALVKDGKNIEAIKEARKALGLSLIEAKEYVDSL
ncbi:hypothetical protein [Pseudalkalibacillus decolorationis]|uniref:hypothetical protein n=1 Tax=Pseudalkalibacillus decolorationis TaxID=163879 RepID=UPI002147C502|nr:hypothetical protein [Pseudalkalibacillus decolorationis]